MNIDNWTSKLNENTNSILNLLKDSSEEECSFKTKGSWCILEILEHLERTDLAILKFLSSPSNKKNETSEKFGDSKMSHVVYDKKDIKNPSPEIVKPLGKYKTLSEAIEGLIQSRNAIKQAIKNNKLHLDFEMYLHPVFGYITGNDWLYFLYHHSRRHLDQIIKTQNQYLHGIS
ncbi:DinB family protein [Aureibacter tunicatorum]|uniref:DinB-like domain-containing protein n=1 Tax=Aureibacter tunicatorum TaxID=866807 RepID=A0AAE3XJ58_9BACT|nr:DinB family protein [Aureibacter tunicatorum]MDR6238716.1 hypothetical protein [Aureibacter tunicatorum]BDD05353.1 hypothetical protein AUTU_28360 [Aureibacter tunicatorum]